jgi:glyoxylase-like metal-dependent hydrolase (beta-lactamase superfamily II)
LRRVLAEATPEHLAHDRKSRVGIDRQTRLPQELVVAAPFGNQATFVNPDDEVLPGIRAVNAYGHSPGLLAYMIESEGKNLLLWSDVTNHYGVSLQKPEWHAFHDDDKDMAVATRKRILDMATTDGLWVHGYHMPFPSVGFVEKSYDGYRWIPASYQLNL